MINEKSSSTRQEIALNSRVRCNLKTKFLRPNLVMIFELITIFLMISQTIAESILKVNSEALNDSEASLKQASEFFISGKHSAYPINNLEYDDSLGKDFKVTGTYDRKPQILEGNDHRGENLELSIDSLEKHSNKSTSLSNSGGARRFDLFAIDNKNENKTKLVDWWTQLTINKPVQQIEIKYRPDLAEKSHQENIKRTHKDNPIIILKSHLASIRAKHMQLMNKSVPQLLQLDKRLVQQYKLCLKRKMPLYAGMLYRTRDFLVKMAKEVRNEKQILEGFAKQVHSVLDRNLKNETMVREYKSTQPGIVEPLKRLGFDSSSQQNAAISQLRQVQMNSLDRVAYDRKEVGIRPQTTKHHASNILKSDLGVDLGFESPNNRNRINTLQRRTNLTTFNVNFNEANLRKELVNAQSLINRIDESSKELASVVEDISNTFKLAPESAIIRTKQTKLDKIQSIQASNQNSARSLHKSLGTKDLLESFGKLSPNNADHEFGYKNRFNGNELKPIFDKSITSYSDNLNDDLGFDFAPEDVDLS